MPKQPSPFVFLVSCYYVLGGDSWLEDGFESDTVSYSLALSARWVDPEAFLVTGERDKGARRGVSLPREGELLRLAAEPFGSSFSLRGHSGRFSVHVGKSFAEFYRTTSRTPEGESLWRIRAFLVVQKEVDGIPVDFCRAPVSDLLVEAVGVEQ